MLIHSINRKDLIMFINSAILTWGPINSFIVNFLHEDTTLTAPNQLFELPLDYFLVKLYNLLRHGLLSPFEWCVATSFYQSSANHVSFYLLFNLRNLLYLIIGFAICMVGVIFGSRLVFQRTCERRTTPWSDLPPFALLIM